MWQQWCKISYCHETIHLSKKQQVISDYILKYAYNVIYLSMSQITNNIVMAVNIFCKK